MSEQQSWAVTVERNGENIVTIGSNHLSGRDLSAEDEQTIGDCARHLLAFVGDPAVEREHADLLTTRITPLSHALRKIARAGRLSSLSVPVLDYAADEIDKLTAKLRAAPRETLPPAVGELVVDVHLGPSRHAHIEGPCGVRPVGFDEVVAAAHDALDKASRVGVQK